MRKKHKINWPFHAMLFPGALLVFVYCYIPMAGIMIAFQKFNPGKGVLHSPWVGWDNFRFVFAMEDTLQVIYNTVFIAVLKIVVGFVVPILFALLLNEVRKTLFKRTVQTLVYLPHFMSWVILGGILVDILSPSNGLVGKAMSFFGLEPVFFLGRNDWFPFVLVLSDVWKEFGFGTIVYLAALTSINPSLYEAAKIDGANRWKQTIHISIPGIVPMIVLVGTLSLGNVLNAGFDQVYNLYSPLVYERGDIIDTLIYRLGLESAQYGVATALGLFKSLVSFVLIATSYFVAYRFANYRIF
ncbi:protein lplB [Paenibacillus sp. MY03]|uniref:ABC transporter permease n=1 Tax=Paenibacillus sp. MY03 TaxID=302980 RepID=UPI000B3C0741|nr:ABC transporter permease subunit [Paenibacillus sp. MY03]OUS75527.1 protein lplB [Paenibacillus sp. MY03]